ncbi:MAG: hypothetical protein SFU98_10895 [Leptospiraceae bacterium]|nr:hypothetical protein [Leptospiraceae bacterium]
MKLIFLILVNSTILFAFPGDQEPLACECAFTGSNCTSPNEKLEAKNARKILFAKGLSKKYDATNDFTYAHYSATTADDPKLSEEVYRTKNKDEATKTYIEAIKKYHNPSKKITKLGDSLSDLVDLYGVILPQKNGMHGASGAFGGLTLWYVDSWDDYISYGAGVSNPNGIFTYQNLGVSGDTSIGLLGRLGVNKSISIYEQDILDTGTFCLGERTGSNLPWYQEPILAPGKTTTRSQIMIGGNDVFSTGVQVGFWLPFAARRLVDYTSANVATIVDWHMENGKKVFLEGNIPILSHPASGMYNSFLFNRTTICGTLQDITIDPEDVPWYVLLIPGAAAKIMEWNHFVVKELRIFVTAIKKPPYGEHSQQAASDPFYELNSNNPITGYITTLQGRGKRPQDFLQDPNSRMFLTAASIAQTCLNDRIRDEILPTYKEAFPKNIDGYTVFDHFVEPYKTLQYAPNFWSPEYSVYEQNGAVSDLFNNISIASLPGGMQTSGPFYTLRDAIHIGPEGYKRWGQVVGLKLAILGWQNPGNSEDADIAVTFEKNDGFAAIRKRAIELGFIGKEKGLGQYLTAIKDKTFGGVMREYKDGKAIYATKINTDEYRKSNNKIETYFLYGGVLTEYLKIKGHKSGLGMPISEQMCWGVGIFCNFHLALFENGYILYDATPVFGGRVSDLRVFTNSHLSPADTAKDPDFKTCIPSCGSRWFAHNTIPFTPDSGTPPFKWSFEGGGAPPNHFLTEKGLFYGTPTNNNNGEWKFKVKLEDARGKSIVKDVIFTTGL